MTQNPPRAVHLVWLLLAGLLYSQTYGALTPWTQEREARASVEGQYLLPSSSTLQALSLNYRIFSATLVWIDALVYFGTYRMDEWERAPARLGEYARLIAGLDPNFARVYLWFNATYIQTHNPTTFEQLEYAADIMDEGIARFPNSSEMLYAVAMNYIGYGPERTPEQRAHELSRAIGYLQRCAQLPGCHPEAASTISYLYKRRASLLQAEDTPNDDLEARRDFYLSLYSSLGEEEQRSRIYAQLLRLGVEDARIVQDVQRREKTFKQATLRRYPYLPLELWALTTSGDRR